jgi:hypothetical protein
MPLQTSAKTGPQRIQLSRAKGWRIPDDTVVVARPTKWGNPFRIGKRHARLDCVTAYGKWIRGTPEGMAIAEAAQGELRGKNLACWCPVDGSCHGDILLQIANGLPYSKGSGRRPKVRRRAARAA